MFDYEYLDANHMKGFDKYKYRAIDTSPLSNYVMHPFWNFIVKLIPTWIAPNLLTLLGFMCIVAVALMTWWYDPDWYASSKAEDGQYGIPNAVFTASALLILLAYNLDGIDGKQARRIGVSGPLGEMFDHGLDSYIVFLIPYCVFSIFGRDVYSVSLFRGYLIILSVTLNFYVSHWEKYNTGVLYLPWGYDVAMWAAVALFLVAGWNGPAYFKAYVIGNVTFAQILEVAIHATGLFTTLPVSIYNVYISHQERRSKYYRLTEAMRPLWSITFMIIMMTCWGIMSPNSIMENHPRIFLLLFGTQFSNIASRLIVSEMSVQRCDVFNPMLWPTILAAVTSLHQPDMEVYSLYTLLVISLTAHLHYGICVVRQMCQHFKVNCFTVNTSKIKA